MLPIIDDGKLMLWKNIDLNYQLKVFHLGIDFLAHTVLSAQLSTCHSLLGQMILQWTAQLFTTLLHKVPHCLTDPTILKCPVHILTLPTSLPKQVGLVLL